MTTPCCYPRCRQEGDNHYCGFDLCDKHDAALDARWAARDAALERGEIDPYPPMTGAEMVRAMIDEAKAKRQ
jgi:hypothetical protein